MKEQAVAKKIHRFHILEFDLTCDSSRIAGQNPNFSSSIFASIWFARFIVNEIGLAGLLDRLTNELARPIEYTGLQVNGAEHIRTRHT